MNCSIFATAAGWRASELVNSLLQLFRATVTWWCVASSLSSVQITLISTFSWWYLFSQGTNMYFQEDSRGGHETRNRCISMHKLIRNIYNKVINQVRGGSLSHRLSCNQKSCPASLLLCCLCLRQWSHELKAACQLQACIQSANLALVHSNILVIIACKDCQRARLSSRI